MIIIPYIRRMHPGNKKKHDNAFVSRCAVARTSLGAPSIFRVGRSHVTDRGDGETGKVANILRGGTDMVGYMYPKDPGMS